MKRPLHIGVLGPHTCTEEERAWGVAVGRAVAREGAVLFCGGLDGMMEAAASGAREAGGRTVGLLPGSDKSEANDYIDLALPTGLGALRNALLVRACDAVIAVSGAYGTLSEIAFALRLKVPVVGLHTWELRRGGEADPGIHVAESPEDAVRLAVKLATTAHEAVCTKRNHGEHGGTEQDKSGFSNGQPSS